MRRGLEKSRKKRAGSNLKVEKKEAGMKLMEEEPGCRLDLEGRQGL